MTDQDKIKIIVDDETRDAIDDIIRIFDERFKNPEWANTFVEEIKKHIEDTKTSLKNEIITDVVKKLAVIEGKLTETQNLYNKYSNDLIPVKSILTSTDKHLKELPDQLLQKTSTFVEEIKRHIGDTKTSLKNEIIADIAQKLTVLEDKLNELGSDLISVKSQLTSIDKRLSDLDTKLDGRLKQMTEQLLQKHDDLIVQQVRILEYIALPWWKKILGGRV